MGNSQEINLRESRGCAEDISLKEWKCIDEYFSLIAQFLQQFSTTRKKKPNQLDPFQKKYSFLNIINEIDWKSFLLQNLALEYEDGKLWVADLYRIINNESFYSEKRWKNLSFWQEFELKTKPDCLYKKTSRKFYPQSDYFTYEIIKEKKRSSTSEYRDFLEKVYSYVRIIKQHIMDEEHPFNFIIKQFVKIFTKEVEQNVDKLVDMKIHKTEQFKKECNNICDDIIRQLQGFIDKLVTSLIIFYAKTMNYMIFIQGDDEFVNLITGIIFEEGDLYRHIMHLIELNELEPSTEFKGLLTSKAQIFPEEAGIPDKFCLNALSIGFYESTIKKSPVVERFTQGLPYEEAISLFRTVVLYKKPYDKLLLLSKLSISVSDCVTKFWKNVDDSIPMESLGIEVDDLRNIFIYIILKAQVKELVPQMKFISLFTSTKTRSNMIGYYYTTIQFCMETIKILDDKSSHSSLLRDCEALLESSDKALND